MTSKENKNRRRAQDTITVDHHFMRTLEARGPFGAEACFQCRKCTNGCPAAFAMDLMPDEVIRLALLGQKERVLSCHTIWVCSACETCTTRCPNAVKIAELMDGLKEMAVEAGIKCPEPGVLHFHEIFLKQIQKRGRIFEPTLLAAHLLKSGVFWEKWQNGSLWADMNLGFQMTQKGRMPFLPHKIDGMDTVRKIMSRPETGEKS